MSDCTNGGRRAYNAPTHAPAEDRLEITVHFKGEYNPHPIVLNRLDREVDYVTVDGERYERVRECEVESSIHWDTYHGGDFYEHKFSCGHTVRSDYEEPSLYCKECGAKVRKVVKR